MAAQDFFFTLHKIPRKMMSASEINKSIDVHLLSKLIDCLQPKKLVMCMIHNIVLIYSIYARRTDDHILLRIYFIVFIYIYIFFNNCVSKAYVWPRILNREFE